MKQNSRLTSSSKKKVVIFVVWPVALVLLFMLSVTFMALIGVPTRFLDDCSVVFFLIYGLLGLALTIYPNPIVNRGIFHLHRATAWALRIEGVFIIAISVLVLRNIIHFLF